MLDKIRNSRIWSVLNKHSFPVACGLILGFFLLSRLPFFIYFPLPGCFVSDAFEYFKVAFEMKNKTWPLFDFRTPGYPLFVYIIDLFSDKIITLVIVQNLLTLLAAVFLTRAVHLTYRQLTYPVCFALIFFFTGNNSIEADSSVVTNSLFSNLLLVFIGLFILAVHRNKYWVLLSFCTGALIYIRPSGLFIIPIIVLIGLYIFLSKKYSIGTLLKLVGPLVLMLLSLSFYNYKTLGIFALSPFGGLALAGATTTMMDTSAEYTACENKALLNLQKLVTTVDRDIVRNSNNPYALHPVFFNNHYYVFNLYKDLINECGYSNFVEALPAVKKIATGAVRNHPGLYLKFVLTGYYHFIFTGNLLEHQLFYYSEVQRRYEDIYIKRKPVGNQYFATYVPDLIPADLKQFAYKEFYNPPPDPVGFDKRKEALKNNFIFKLFDIYTLKFNRIFLRNWFWPIALICIFLFSGFKLLVSRLRNREALIVFVVCCFLFCSAALICLVEPSFYVYTYMTEFTYFLAPALFPILFLKNNTANLKLA